MFCVCVCVCVCVYVCVHARMHFLHGLWPVWVCFNDILQAKMFICWFSQNRVYHCIMQLVVEEEEEDIEKEFWNYAVHFIIESLFYMCG